MNTFYNDLGFKVKDKFIIMVEHQSTVNPNMPLRMLLYLAEEYQRFVVDSKSYYKSKLIKLPTPELYVVYTGRTPKNGELKLSDAFISKTNFPFVEVKVKSFR